MKKTLIFALLFAAGAAFAAAPTQPGNKKQKAKAAAAVQKVELATPSDTLSYAAGQSFTRGLMEYVTQQLHVDSAHIGDFTAALREQLASAGDPAFAARAAAATVAQMVDDRMLPNVSKAFEGTSYNIDREKFNRGFIDAVTGDTAVMNVEAAAGHFDNVRKAEETKKNEAYKQENAAWLADNAKKEGVVTLPSGLQYKVINTGTGAVAKQDDNVTVRYEGRTIDGNVFDSSYKRNPNTTSFRPNQVIKGWTEALTMMPEGSKWELYIPQELAYGARQAGQIKPFSTLIFTVEVVKVEAKAEPKADAAEADKAAAKTKTAAAKTAKTAKAKKK